MNSLSLAARLALIVTLSLAAIPAAAQPETGSDIDARAIFDQGRAAYDEERFEDAVRAFRRAYVLSPRYQLLYNIGQAELRAGHDDRALEAFEGFLRQAPDDAPLRSEVEERVRVLRSMGVTPSVASEAPSEDPPAQEPVTEPAPDPEPAPRPASAPSDAGVAPWIVVGAGAAVMVAGAVLMGVGYSEAERVTGAEVGSRWAELRGSADAANTLWGVGIGAAALGLAAVGAGVVWAVVGGSSGESEREGEGATARVQVGLGSLAIQGEF